MTYVYKPSNAIFEFKELLNFKAQPTNFIIGDINSHHTSCGFDVTDDNSHKVELWAKSNGTKLSMTQSFHHIFIVVGGETAIIQTSSLQVTS